MRPVRFLVLGLVLFLAAEVAGQEPPARLPAVREVWLDTKELPHGLGAGSWSIVPRQDYTAALQKAQAVAAARQQPPWLLEAHYEARFAQHQLHGTVALKLHNPHPVAALARLTPWTLPPTETELTTGLVGMGEHLLGVEVPAAQTATRNVKWSLHGEQRGDGTWFQIQLPACAVATFDVDLPFPYRLDWPAGRQYLSGPLPTAGGDRRWRLTLGGAGRNEVQVVVRAGAGGQHTPWTEARLDGDFVVGAARLEARYECDLQRWQGRLTAATFETPAGFVLRSAALRSAGVETPLPWQASPPGVVQVTFPETVEQRATVVLTGEFPLPADGRVRFELPHIRGADAVRPTVHVVSSVSRPLGDWEWGDFGPEQAPESDTRRAPAVEVLTLAQRRLVADGRPQPASARLSSRKEEVAYRQDAWMHWEPDVVRLVSRCQCTVLQGQVGMLSWSVPAGWEVKDVTAGAGTGLSSWACQPGGPLLVEPKTAWGAGQTAIVTVTLEAAPVAGQRQTWRLPHLVPALAGPFSGSYAITLSRRGSLAPPGVTIVGSPGTEAYPPADGPALWAGQAAVPDFYWRLTRPTGGEILVEPWEPKARVEVRTQVEGAERIRYRVTVQPAAGAVTRVLLRSTEQVPELSWHVVGKGQPGRWEGKTPRSGELLWPQPLEHAVTLECEVSWEAGRPVPLLSAMHGTHWLELPARYQPSGDTGLLADGAGRWRYTAESPGCILRSTLAAGVAAPRAVLAAVVQGRFVEYDFTALVPGRDRAVTLRLPMGVEGAEAWLDGKVADLGPALQIPACADQVRARLRYRAPIESFLGIRWTDLVTPTVDDGETMVVRQSWRFPRPVALAPGWASGESPSGVMMQKIDGKVWWIDRGDLAAYGLLGCFALVVLRRRIVPWLAGGTLAVLAVAVVALPSGWGVLPVWLAVGLLPALFSWRGWGALRRRQGGPVVFSLVAVLPWSAVVAQGEGDPVLVYLFTAERRQDDRAVLPMGLWSQLQTLARQEMAGSDRQAVVESVRCEGEWALGRLRVSAVWVVRVHGEGAADLPWPGPASLVEASIDGTAVSPRLLPGPFGLDRLVVRMPGPGRHDLRVTYDVTPRRGNAVNTLDLPLPGAPVQSVQISLPGQVTGLTLAGAGGARVVTHEGEATVLRGDAGLAAKVTLTWFSPRRAPAEVEARAGVLWEHRLSQSTAHAVVRYEIDQGALDVLELDVPAGVRVRSVNVIGEVQASVTPRVAGWALRPQGSIQRLSVQLQRPVSGVVHLLLELPWDRGSGAEVVPLAGVRPVGAPVVGGFVAFLADGLNAEPEPRLAPVAAEQLEFARPWLPSLALLPASAATRLTDLVEPAPMLRLTNKPSQAHLCGRQEIVLGSDGVTYRFRYEVEAEEGLPCYLSARLDPGLSVSEVRCPQVLRWQQTPGAAGRPGRLEVWLKVRPATDRTTTLTALCQPTLPPSSPERQVLPLAGLHWEQGAETAATLFVIAPRAGLVEAVQGPRSLRGLLGPWVDPAVVAAYEVSQEAIAGQHLVVTLQRQQQLPIAVAELRQSPEGAVWELTLTAAATAPLPPRLEAVMPRGHLEDGWSFSADVPVAAVPRRDAAGQLVWSLQLARSAGKLTLRCHVTEGTTPPVVVIPEWPALKIGK